MLRHVVGDSLFFDALLSYTNDPRFRFGVATTEDFQEVFETVSGLDLDYFFQQWIYGERYPSYTYWWESTPVDSGYAVTVGINQTTGTSNPAFFTMPIDIKLSAPPWDTTVVLMNTFSGQEFTFTVSNDPETVALDPESWIVRNATMIPVSVAENPETPAEFKLYQNYPNPFNPTTDIRFEMGDVGFVTLRVYDLLGREVATLVNEKLSPGIYTRQWDATAFPSGVYYYRLSTGNDVQTRKLVLLR